MNLSHGGSDVALNIYPQGSTSLLYGQEESTRYALWLQCPWYVFGAAVSFRLCENVEPMCTPTSHS